ncbi:diguanylate cyclase [Paenibacillus sp. IB182496]|uniref:Diguanylate cyclase n=1 Tax=Paenibacillus sabuli TaxID=2772509 RepID=A0A927BSA5_9BACL|nr:histidine kinase N-terminal 7TM domain-containing protein [Paenibacillus sabuli]MBD2845377.1 diguanylate cyclase [Paenibacillus sabuli]
MQPSLTMLITLVTTSGVMMIFLFMYALLQRNELPGARIFIPYTAVQAIYIFAVSFEMTSDTLDQIKFWGVIEYIGIAGAPALGLLLVMRYIGKTITPRLVVILLIIPVITLFMVATNDWHHLFYKDIYWRPDSPFPTVDIVIGEWYIVHGAYTFGSMFAAAVLLIRRWPRTHKRHRLQLATFIVGQMIPITAAFVYLMGITPYGMDPVPMVLSISSALYIWVLFSTRMLTIVPIAKEHLFESMREGVIVLSPERKLVDFNGAVSRMLPGLSTDMLGLTLDEAWQQLTGVVFPVRGLRDGEQKELPWVADGRNCCYQVRSSLIRGKDGEPVGSLLMFIDVTEQRLLQEQLHQLAYYDGMTNLLNRMHFIHIARELLQDCWQRGRPLALILFDIDHFKSINDKYGHETGDSAIVHVVTIARQLLPPGLPFARFGGEEFVIALPDCTVYAAEEEAERIRAALEADPLQSSEGPIVATASFGVTESRLESAELTELLREADEALYAAKRGGRNQVRSYMSNGKERQSGNG